MEDTALPVARDAGFCVGDMELPARDVGREEVAMWNAEMLGKVLMKPARDCYDAS